MVYKYVSVHHIVEKLYRDYDHQEELDLWDIIEWAGEALEFIGAGQQYEPRITELTLVNAMAALPCNYHGKPFPAYQGVPMTLATGAFAPMAVDQTNVNQNLVNGKTVSNSTFPASGNGSTASPMIPQSYYIRDGVFVASVQEGTVVLQYDAVKTDADGYPMIPDLQSYREAIAKYCQMKLDHKDWRRGRIPDKIYKESLQDWQWYCGQARGTANMPDLNMAESIKNQWVRLRPNQNAADSFYNTLAVREMRKNNP